MSRTHGYREEKDFLGSREVPEGAYYGIQTLRATENFPITGYRLHPRFIRSLATVKKAAALANITTGDLPAEIGWALVTAADRIINEEAHPDFIVDPIQGGAGTSANMNANEVIANLAIELMGGEMGDYKRVSPNSHVNMAQSTNDVFPTAVRITAALMLEELIATVTYLKRSLQEKGQEFNHVVKMGRTHLQDAVPIRMGQEFMAWASAIDRDLRRLDQAKVLLLEVNMGATAVGTGLNASPEYDVLVLEQLRELTRLDLKRPENLVDATQNVDSLVEVSSALKALSLDLIKIANDLRLMASGPRAGLYEIELPPRQPGSSIMPGKVNPVMPEVVNQVCFRVLGNDLTISLAAQAGQFELNVMEPVLAFSLFESLDILKNAIAVFIENCLNGIVANEERCRQMVENSIGIATALGPHLGYELASEVAREAYQSGRSVRQICLERKLFDAASLDSILSPMGMTEPGVAGEALLRRRRSAEASGK